MNHFAYITVDDAVANAGAAQQQKAAIMIGFFGLYFIYLAWAQTVRRKGIRKRRRHR